MILVYLFIKDSALELGNHLLKIICFIMSLIPIKECLWNSKRDKSIQISLMKCYH
jgi:hypothetical protein